MTRIFRATTDSTARTGACFASSLDDALAYTDNPGFGGPDLYAYDVDADRVLDVDGRRDLAQAYIDCLTEDEREALDMAAAELAADWGDYGGHVYHVLEGHRSRRLPSVMDALARAYDWVRYEDSYPVGCQTWMYLGAQPIEPAERV